MTEINNEEEYNPLGRPVSDGPVYVKFYRNGCQKCFDWVKLGWYIGILSLLIIVIPFTLVSKIDSMLNSKDHDISRYNMVASYTYRDYASSASTDMVFVLDDFPGGYKSNEWDFAISRLKIDIGKLPIFVMDMFPGSTTETIYYVSLTYNGIIKTTAVIYHSENGIFDLTDPNYFFVNTRQHLLNLVNDAYTKTYNALKSQIPSYPVTGPPTFVYSQSGIYLTNNASPPSARMYMDKLLYNRFFFGMVGVVTSESVYVGLGVEILAFPNNRQEVELYARWFSLDKLLLISDSIPTKKETIRTNKISDLKVIQSIDIANMDKRDSIAYYPGSNYKLSNLMENWKPGRVEIRILWQDSNGVVYPLKMPVGSRSSLQFTLTRKK